MSIKQFTVLWKGRTLITIWGISEDKIKREILAEAGIKELPPQTVIFESYKI